ncbi:MAG TPA: tetratricopeptide repeat protein [Verrucomicrobiae bacterium]|jgi:tetratricopeptide (TPR) repeat protein|nr:tetratricopeptide repeat protein [Verrucomicrobiae bacterium]
MTATPGRSETKCGWIGAALFLVTLAVYAGCLRHQFLTFDDQIYVTENPHAQAGWTWASLSWAFSTFRTGNWHPVTWLSHMTDCAWFGLRPWGHHLTNIVLHASNAALLFFFLQRLTKATWQSAAVAGLFAWHPAHVESVAWVAERKDVLSGFFFLWTLYFYTAYVQTAKRWSYGAALASFAVGLMAKPMLVTVPFVLLLLDYWPFRRRALLEKLPFLALSAASCWVTMLAQAQAHAIAGAAELGVAARLEHAIVSYGRYLEMLVFPHNLAVFYPYENGGLAAAALALAAGCAAVIYGAKRWPYLAVGWLWFLGMLIPVIGLVQVGSQGWADRYTYLPSIGFFIAVVWMIGPAVKYLAWPVAGLLIALTVAQETYWRDTRTLFERTVNVTRDNYMALALLGSVADGEGRLGEAETDELHALQAREDYAPAHFFLGHIREEEGRGLEAMQEYARSVALTPYFEQAHLFLGVAQVKAKDYASAEMNYRAALEINPESASAHNDLGKLHQLQGRLEESRAEYEAALRLDPKLAQAHNNLGIVLLQENKPTEGAAELRRALQLSPTNAPTALNLAMALSQQAQWQDAVKTLLQGAEANSHAGHRQEAAALAQEAQRLAQEHGDEVDRAAASRILSNQ